MYIHLSCMKQDQAERGALVARHSAPTFRCPCLPPIPPRIQWYEVYKSVELYRVVCRHSHQYADTYLVVCGHIADT